MTNYMLYDEDGELMRVVGRQEEAIGIMRTHSGWTFKRIRTPKPILDLSQFEDALI